MTMPSFAADASLYASRRHYRAGAARIGDASHPILAQSLFCSRLGQSCGGIDLVCCPGLRCTAGLGELGICEPDLFHCSRCLGGRQICCPPRGFGLRCFVRPCISPL
jgi:hypothetical protein